MRCLRRIGRTRFQILKCYRSATWRESRPRWWQLYIVGMVTSHGWRTPVSPKTTFYSELNTVPAPMAVKDLLKTNMRACDLPPNEFENLTADRSSWRSSFKKQVLDFERRRISTLQDKRVQLLPDRGFTCDTCSRVCASRMGLISHQRTPTAQSRIRHSRPILQPTHWKQKFLTHTNLIRGSAQPMDNYGLTVLSITSFNSIKKTLLQQLAYRNWDI